MSERGSSDRYKIVETLYQRACDLAPERREAFLQAECGADAQLRSELASLLGHYAAASSNFLAMPVHDLERHSDADRTTPQRIGTYTIIRMLGRGGMGTVYEAEQSQPRRRVALKVVRSDAVTDDALRRFRHEAEALGQLGHPGIAQIYEFGEARVWFRDVPTHTQPYFAMELVQGRLLREYAASGNLKRAGLLELFACVCDAVQHAHQKGVIHRDLKPTNILVVEEGTEPPATAGTLRHEGTKGREATEQRSDEATKGKHSALSTQHSAPSAQPKILDFGLARIATDEPLSVRTQADHVLGTIAYMSPEQVSGDWRNVDTRSDVYSLGVILYELLSGRLPLNCNNLSLPEAARVIREDAPAPLSSADASLRGDLETIVACAMQKEAARRYASAGDLAADVRRFLKREPISARPATALYQMRRFAQRNRALVTGFAATFAALVLGIIGTSAGLVRAERRRSEAETARREEERQRKAADEQRALAEQRYAETLQVADFQSEMLREIDVDAMGRGIMQGLREQVKSGLEREWIGQWPDRRRRTPEEVDQALAIFDAAAAPSQPADVARRIMDEFVLGLAGDALQAEFADQPLVQAKMHDAIGRTYQSLGCYDAALPHLKSALDLRRHQLGMEHTQVATSANNLAILHQDMGDHAEAERLHRETLEMRRRLQGESHPDVATSLNNLAGVLRSQGKPDEAEPLYRESLALCRKWLGNEHAHVASSLNNLGLLSQDKGDYAAAERLLREGLDMRRKLLGSEHADVSASLDNLAGLLRRRGNLSEAEPLLRESLAISRKIFGDEHPHVATTLSSLALVLQDKAEFRAAEPLLREALALRRKLLGNRHPAVAAALNNLGLLLHHMGEFETAEPLYREALAIRRSVLGDDNPHVANSLNNLGGLLKSKGDLAAAEPILREALALQRRLKGGNDLAVATSLTNLGSLLAARRDRAGAEALFREALAIRRSRLVDDHPEVATSINNLASILHDIRDFAGAEPLYREALAIYRKRVQKHPHLASCLNNLGRLLRAKGDYAEAETLVREAVDMRRGLFGPNHPSVAATLHNLAGLMFDKGDYAQAEPIFREALAMRRQKLPLNHLDLVHNRSGLGRTLTRIAAGQSLETEARCEKFREAQSLLLSAQESLSGAPAAPPELARAIVNGLVELYDAWHQVEPEKEYDTQADEWRVRLSAIDSADAPE